MALKQRLSKVLARAGIASRRACEELIFSGKVAVNGKVVLIPQTLVDPAKDLLTVYGEKVSQPKGRLYYLLNKPKGYICSNRRTSKRTNLVIDLFAEVNATLFTVGRLDKDTLGLLIVTNDGHFANTVIHPKAAIHKEYVAKTDKEISDFHLKALSRGMSLEGVYIKPLSVHKVRRNVLKVVIGEGRKHEVRYLLEEVGLSVLELKRTRLGNLRLGALPPGSWRPMTRSEAERVFD